MEFKPVGSVVQVDTFDVVENRRESLQDVRLAAAVPTCETIRVEIENPAAIPRLLPEIPAGQKIDLESGGEAPKWNVKLEA
jgi:hypothetical protein